MIPKVSVCIPTYNYARYLPQAIESVLSQRFSDYELLIIDDGSTDGTAEVVREFASRDRRIGFRQNPSNIGMVQNWNRCLRESRGEYVKFLFGDDLFPSRETLERMAAALDADRSVSLVASARNVIDADSTLLEVWSDFEGSTVSDGAEIILRCFESQRNLIGEPSAVMFRRCQATRGFDTRYRQLVDLEMWFHLLEQGKFSYVDEPLAAFRVHPDQQTRVNEMNLSFLEDTKYLFEDYLCNKNKPYLKLNFFHRNYLVFDQSYRIWKAYKQGRIGKDVARSRISADYGLSKFLFFYPFYKVYKPFRKLRRRLRESFRK